MTEENNTTETPEENRPPEMPETLDGPELHIRFEKEGATPDDRGQMFLKASDEFPPFMVVVFEQDGSAHFGFMPSPKVSPSMMAAAGDHIKAISDFNRQQSILAQMERAKQNRILVPGMQIPPDFNAKG